MWQGSASVVLWNWEKCSCCPKVVSTLAMLLPFVLSWRVSQAWVTRQIQLSPGTWSLCTMTSVITVYGNSDCCNNSRMLIGWENEGVLKQMFDYFSDKGGGIVWWKTEHTLGHLPLGSVNPPRTKLDLGYVKDKEIRSSIEPNEHRQVAHEDGEKGNCLALDSNLFMAFPFWAKVVLALTKKQKKSVMYTSMRSGCL